MRITGSVHRIPFDPVLDLDDLAEYEITYECCQCGQLSRSTPATHAPMFCTGCGNATHRVRWDQSYLKATLVHADRTS